MPRQIDLESCFAVSNDIIAKKIENEYIIVPLNSGVGDLDSEIYSLNQSGSILWEELDGKQTLNEIISKFVKKYDAPPKKILKDVMERERLVTTGTGYGVALPRARSEAVEGIVIVFGRSKKGIDFDSMDREHAHIFFLVVAPKGASDYVNVMAVLTYLLGVEKNRKKLMKTGSPKGVLKLLDSVE